MKINRHHRLPGSDGKARVTHVVDSYVLEVEADGLFVATLDSLPGNLRLPIVQLCHCKSEQEFAQFYERIIDLVLSAADSNAFVAADGPRSKCPLCHGGPQSAYSSADGFLLPTGLEKHLVGHQRAYECAVLAAARRRAAASVRASASSHN